VKTREFLFPVRLPVPPESAPTRPELSVVVPIHDERESLPQLLEELRRALPLTRLRWEIILVDDGSLDGSAEWTAAEASKSHDVIAVLLERNAGQSAALVAGIGCAKGHTIVTLDGDLQNDPADIPRLLERMASERADVVSGIRATRQDGWRRRVSSRIANSVRRRFVRDTITDIGCSLKAYRAEAIEGLPAFQGVHRFLPALCQVRGARVVELVVGHRPRLHGRSKYGVSNRLARGLRDLVGVMWLRSRLLKYRIREVVHG
jgi:dolichol-phosphate mannosyltransferase